jgi:diphthamide synthase (EF-2-diphthine--ammonia ligase)
MDPVALLQEVAKRMEAIIVVTAAGGLDESFLGARIDDELILRLQKVASRYRINLAGEGGEYESLTLNAPFYTRPITYTHAEIQKTVDRSELVLGGFA